MHPVKKNKRIFLEFKRKGVSSQQHTHPASYKNSALRMGLFVYEKQRHGDYKKSTNQNSWKKTTISSSLSAVFHLYYAQLSITSSRPSSKVSFVPPSMPTVWNYHCIMASDITSPTTQEMDIGEKALLRPLASNSIKSCLDYAVSQAHRWRTCDSFMKHGAQR